MSVVFLSIPVKSARRIYGSSQCVVVVYRVSDECLEAYQVARQSAWGPEGKEICVGSVFGEKD
jgi:hypothetical protein